MKETKHIVFPTNIHGSDAFSRVALGKIGNGVSKIGLIYLLDQLLYETHALAYAVNEIYAQLNITQNAKEPPPPPPPPSIDDYELRG